MKIMQEKLNDQKLNVTQLVVRFSLMLLIVTFLVLLPSYLLMLNQQPLFIDSSYLIVGSLLLGVGSLSIYVFLTRNDKNHNSGGNIIR